MKFLRRFYYAWSGIKALVILDFNVSLHVIFMLVVILVALLLKVETYEMMAILIVSALVITLESFNSAIERLIDHLHPEKHEQIRIVKDMLAGAVLIASFFAVIIAAIIFLPKLLHLLA